MRYGEEDRLERRGLLRWKRERERERVVKTRIVRLEGEGVCAREGERKRNGGIFIPSHLFPSPSLRVLSFSLLSPS